MFGKFSVSIPFPPPHPLSPPEKEINTMHKGKIDKADKITHEHIKLHSFVYAITQISLVFGMWLGII